ncbi:ribonuclease R [Bdellovibrio reynosensis]|uniref:Ribonuclease R n=1 Tax=Bdellovibrio reynosensis TaxID=2835041 RepID=A0ABY4C5L3_9BACT|nr:ribonuclease R [Bdellovibrio reynosensis]UOF00024.1 ribonuclease R [Bdellovibrio reynosensis]
MQKKQLLNGTIKRHPDGFGFFIPEDVEHPDVYIPRHSMEGVMTNDKVSIEVFPEKGTDRFRGEIVKIISRGTKTVVGRFYQMNDRIGAIRDEGKGWGQDLKIKLEDSQGAKDKELVAAEIITYPEEGKSFTGKVTEVIGDALDPLTDIKRVILSNNIPQNFSRATLEEAEEFSELPDEKDFKDRVDLRDKNLITIDGATAKDFDDAVHVEMTEEGFLLYVAIADVSHYVKIGTAIDKDAYERGTSVYFPNFVVPMLPEVLSNGLCSLNPHVPRLCLVAEMLFDYTGEMKKSRFYEGVMESKARVTYGEAQEIIDGNDIEKFAHVKENILRLSDLAKILMVKRFKEGSLDLEIPETELVIDGAGVPIDIQRSERLFSHRLIEEMMLAANVAVAKFLMSREIPALYRIHEPPNEMAIRLLEKYLASFGGKTKLGQGKLQKRLTKALEEFENRPEAQILNILTLRAMSQAKYSMNNVGHFGLGFEDYTHFTSPIRRYPDLIVHRLIKNQVMPNSKYRLMSEDDLASAGTILSAAEQRSTKAERQVQSIKKARFMQKFVGQEFDGMISSVAKFGIFVLLREYDIDGLVRLEDLGGERFEFDEESLRLVAKKSGFSYNIGDAIKIQVTAADPELGQINFAIPGLEARKGGYEKETSAEISASRFLKKLHRKDEEIRGKKSGKPGEGRHRDERRGEDRRSGEDRRQSERRGPEKLGFGKNKEREPQQHHGKGGKSAFFRDSRQEERGQQQKIEKAHRSMGLKPEPREDRESKPDENLLRMILGPDAYRKNNGEERKEVAKNTGKETSAKDKPKLSKKLIFAEKSKLRDNEDYDTSEDRNPDRKDTKKRSTPKNDSRGVRKTRVSPGRGKGSAR